VTCPVALYPATSESEKISFNQLNRQTGHRIKYLKVDAETGEEVPNEDIVKGYELKKGQYIEVTKDELDEIALESTRTIEIDEFVDKADIDPRYLIRPYYLRPDGKVGHDAFAVIRETIREMDKVAIGRVVLANREHIIALEPLDKGLVGTLLRYPYEVRSKQEYFDEIQNVKVTKDMLDLARHIVNQKAGRFEPEKFEDLCLPQIKPEHIGDAVHPGSAGTECTPLPRRHVISARPCSTISECACKIAADGEDAARRTRQRGQDIPGGSNRSPFHNTRSATAIARRLADPECPSPEGGG
jgi:Ku protein